MFILSTCRCLLPPRKVFKLLDTCWRRKYPLVNYKTSWETFSFPFPSERAKNKIEILMRNTRYTGRNKYRFSFDNFKHNRIISLKTLWKPNSKHNTHTHKYLYYIIRSRGYFSLWNLYRVVFIYYSILDGLYFFLLYSYCIFFSFRHIAFYFTI